VLSSTSSHDRTWNHDCGITFDWLVVSTQLMYRLIFVALMRDQVMGLRNKGIPATMIWEKSTPAEINEVRHEQT
jgi:hypothetical protein